MKNPLLLKTFCVKKKVITIDAIGAQKNIVSKIIAKGGNYVLGVKGQLSVNYSTITNLNPFKLGIVHAIALSDYCFLSYFVFFIYYVLFFVV